MSRNDCRIYVGNLPPDIRTKDIQDLFYKFGKVLFVDLKNRRGPPFAFVEFDDPRYVIALFLIFSIAIQIVVINYQLKITIISEMLMMPFMPGMVMITTDTD